MNTPRSYAIRFFLRHEQPEPDFHVRASLEPVAAVDVLDIMGTPVFEGASPGTRGHLVFVDEAPDADWAHPCRYGLVFLGGGMVVTKHQWPPAESLRLIAVDSHPDAEQRIGATDECPRCDWIGSWDGAVCPECGHDTKQIAP